MTTDVLNNKFWSWYTRVDSKVQRFFPQFLEANITIFTLIWLHAQYQNKGQTHIYWCSGFICLTHICHCGNFPTNEDLSFSQTKNEKIKLLGVYANACMTPQEVGNSPYPGTGSLRVSVKTCKEPVPGLIPQVSPLTHVENLTSKCVEIRSVTWEWYWVHWSVHFQPTYQLFRLCKHNDEAITEYQRLFGGLHYT